MGGSLRLAVVIALAAPGALWAYRVLTPASYRTSGYCLSYPRSTPRYEFSRDFVFGVFGRRGAPSFRVQSSIPTSSILDDADATGLLVRYGKGGVDGLLPYDAASCPSTDTGLGLLRFEPRERIASGAKGCPDSLYKAAFVPLPVEPLAGQVRILCDDDPRVPNCSMQYRIPNGWTADISLPRTHLSEWRTASAEAHAFFAATLTDCGT